MKKLLALLLGAALLFTLAAPAFAEETPEPQEGHWYDQAVAYVTFLGYMTGTDKGFEPEAIVTRATVFQVLYNMEGKPEVSSAGFADAQGKWYEPAARWAQDCQLTSGTGGGSFDGERTASRGEIVTILYRYAAMRGLDTSSTFNLLTAFDDAEDLSRWAVPPFMWAVEKKIVAGKTDGGAALLKPMEPATRAELAQMLTSYGKSFSCGTAPEKPDLPLPEKSAYADEAGYANFRAVTLGSIAPGRLYRSASPIDPTQGGRQLTADRLLAQTEVKTVVNTADCRFRFTGFDGYEDTYYSTLRHVALNMGHDYPSAAYLEDVYNGLDYMGETPGPYLIHGTQGIRRTGYVCMILEALMGATAEEVLADYVRSYEDYYLVEPGSEAWADARAEAESCLLTFTGAESLAQVEAGDLAQLTRSYLLDTVGLRPEQVAALEANLT